MPLIADTAEVHPTAQLPDDIEVGHFTVIEPGVTLGEGAVIGHHAVIHEGVTIGPRCQIDDHAVIGKQPLRAARSATTEARTQPPSFIGHDVLVGTGAVIYAGARIGSHVLVADYATVREEVTVGDGTIVGRGVAIENGTTVGARCKLETNAYITAYSTIEDDVFVAPGVLTSNDRFLGRTEERFEHFAGPIVRRGARLGVGAVLLPATEVPAETVIGAGAVLTRNAEEGRIHVGVPARPVGPVPEEQRLSSEHGPGSGRR
jgi:UDP-2-acetamido-3-amino-2,3-dideoxy-glucuronate N-acetyltransferase